jgi:hypothetical protein
MSVTLEKTAMILWVTAGPEAAGPETAGGDFLVWSRMETTRHSEMVG